MHRKNYVAIARTIKTRLDMLPQEAPTLRAIAEGLAVEFKRDNGEFKPSVFFAACGLE